MPKNTNHSARTDTVIDLSAPFSDWGPFRSENGGYSRNQISFEYWADVDCTIPAAPPSVGVMDIECSVTNDTEWRRPDDSGDLPMDLSIPPSAYFFIGVVDYLRFKPIGISGPAFAKVNLDRYN